mmetsp:Transcript_9508/g.14313  ORF Transcript_9508/g.14313 Transcript_9508/m.14313 type:complete len:551 (+) Transcript_9508:80-1732(+)
MDDHIEELKHRGNEHYQSKRYEDAVSCYTHALDMNPNHVLCLGNRSACYLAMKQYDKAVHDAKQAIQLDHNYIKGYFRLATSLKLKKCYTEAVKVSSRGLAIDPDNAALKKLHASCLQEQQNEKVSKKMFRNLYSDQPAVSSIGHDDVAANGEPSGQNEKAYTDLEKRIHSCLSSLLTRLKNGEFGPNDASVHMLQGTFKKLVEKDTFTDILFPGVPADVLKDLPKSLPEVFQWEYMPHLMAGALDKMTRSAARILEGVRSRGAARGDTMDAATESVLVPQIAQETFARELVEMVRNISKRASSVNARLNLRLASPDAEEGSMDQLDDSTLSELVGGEGLAVQDAFMGAEWAEVVLSDIVRYASEESMTEMTFTTRMAPLSTDKSAVSSEVAGDRARIAWVEGRDIETAYPALAEAIHNLHALTYEINAKSESCMKLLEPSRGFTMLSHIPVGGIQPARYDNSTGENDSGIRLSCVYNIVPDDTDASDEPVAVSKYVMSTSTAVERSIDIVNDRLLLFKSLEVKNSRTAATREYYQLCFYIHANVWSDSS